MSVAPEDSPFEQPNLDENFTRSVALKNDELKRPYRAYAVVEFDPSRRYGCVQLTIEGNRVTSIRVHGQLEVEKEFADNQLLKTLQWEEKIK